MAKRTPSPHSSSELPEPKRLRTSEDDEHGHKDIIFVAPQGDLRIEIDCHPVYCIKNCEEHGRHAFIVCSATLGAASPVFQRLVSGLEKANSDDSSSARRVLRLRRVCPWALEVLLAIIHHSPRVEPETGLPLGAAPVDYDNILTLATVAWKYDLVEHTRPWVRSWCDTALEKAGDNRFDRLLLLWPGFVFGYQKLVDVGVDHLMYDTVVSRCQQAVWVDGWEITLWHEWGLLKSTGIIQTAFETRLDTAQKLLDAVTMSFESLLLDETSLLHCTAHQPPMLYIDNSTDDDQQQSPAPPPPPPLEFAENCADTMLYHMFARYLRWKFRCPLLPAARMRKFSLRGLHHRLTDIADHITPLPGHELCSPGPRLADDLCKIQWEGPVEAVLQKYAEQVKLQGIKSGLA